MHLKILLLFKAFCILAILGFSSSGEDWIRKGKSSMLDNDYTKAVFYYTKALEEDPSNTKALLQRGKAYLFLDLYHKAIDDYQQAVKLDPRLIKSIKEMSKE